MDLQQLFTVGICSIILIVIAFFALRFLVLWYYRINERVELLKQILIELKKLNAK